MTFDPDDRTTMWLRCRARDLLTDLDGTPHVLGETSLDVRTGPNRVVEAISADPPRPTLEHLVGHRGGAGFRKQIDTAVPGDRAAGSLLYYLLDDIPPATLISGYVWSRFGEQDPPRIPVVPPGETLTPHLPHGADGEHLLGMAHRWYRDVAPGVRAAPDRVDGGSPRSGASR